MKYFKTFNCLLLACHMLLSESLEETNNNKIHVLIYETEVEGDGKNKFSDKKFSPAQRLADQVNQLMSSDIKAVVFGQGEEFLGYGSKYKSILPILQSIQNEQIKNNDDSLIVITDSRDVLLNSPYSKQTDSKFVQQIIDDFVVGFEELTILHPGAIVVSAESQCCVSALTHSKPGGYFDEETGERSQYACASGTQNCLWTSDEAAEPWEHMMKRLMTKRTFGLQYDDAYLNAGLIAGRAKDLIRVIQALKIQGNEDDQAVLTDYMYQHQNDVLLDYKQKLFGNNRGGLSNTITADGCVFHKVIPRPIERLSHMQTGTKPLFLHSPGQYYKCHDKMAEELGYPTGAKAKYVRFQLQRKDQATRKLACNYGLCKDTIIEVPPPPVPVPTPVSSVVIIPAPVDAPTPSAVEIVPSPVVTAPTSSPILVVPAPVDAPTPSVVEIVPAPVVTAPTSSPIIIIPAPVDAPTTPSNIVIVAPPPTEPTAQNSFFDLLNAAHSNTTTTNETSTNTTSYVSSGQDFMALLLDRSNATQS